MRTFGDHRVPRLWLGVSRFDLLRRLDRLLELRPDLAARIELWSGVHRLNVPGWRADSGFAAVGFGARASDLGCSIRQCRRSGRFPTRIARTVTSDLRGSVLSRRAWPGIVLASTVAVMGHVAVFVVAVQVTGMELPVVRLLPLALVVLLASAVPANIAGWGPREGAAA